MYFTKRVVMYSLPDGRALLINTLSGAIDIVAADTAAALRQPTGPATAALDSDLERKLRERGYLFDGEEQERQYYEDLLRTFHKRREQQPVQFAISPTYGCNLHCTYCFEGELTTQRPLRILQADEVRSAFGAIDALRAELHPGAPACVVLFGGEPLMRPNRECVELVLGEAAARELGVEVVTNGVQSADFLPALQQQRSVVRQIQITLDGPPDVHDRRRPLRGGGGSFGRIAATIEALLAADLPVTVRVNVDRDNLGQVQQLMSAMEDRGWTLHPRFSCYIYPVTAYTSAEHVLAEHEVLGELQRMFRGEAGQMPGFALYGFKVLGHVASVLEPASLPIRMPPLATYCEANGLRYFAFGPDHYIYPCGQAVGREPLAIGRFHPALELWPARYREWQQRSIDTIAQCRECVLGTLCGGGCALGAWSRTGSVLEPNCQASRETLDASIGGRLAQIATRG